MEQRVGKDERDGEKEMGLNQVTVVLYFVYFALRDLIARRNKAADG